MLRLVGLVAVTGALLLLSPSAPAHHGAGIFDAETTVTYSGTVTDFQYVNPHVLVYIATTGADGSTVQIAGELTSPNRLSRMSGEIAWHRDVLKPGDEVTMTGHPAKNGAPAIDITKLVNADGVALIGG